MIDINNTVFSKSFVLNFLECYKKGLYVLNSNKYITASMRNGINIHKYIDKLNKNEVCYNNIPKSYKIHVEKYVNFLKTYNLSLPLYSEYETGIHIIEGLKFRGVIDAVFKFNDMYFIVDYKTGVKEYDFIKYKFELQLYSYLFEQDTGLNISGYGVLFTNSGAFISEEKKNYDEMYNIIRLFKEKLVAKNTRLNYNMCSVCDFYSFCDRKEISF